MTEVFTGKTHEKFVIEEIMTDGLKVFQLRKKRRIGSHWLETNEVIELSAGDAEAIGRRLLKIGIDEMGKKPSRSVEGTIELRNKNRIGGK